MAEKHPKRPTDEAMKAKALSRWEGEGGAPPAEGRKPKRPRDPNQWAKHNVDVATGNSAEPDPDAGKDPAAVALGRKGGLKGGAARPKSLSPRQRSRSAAKAAKAPWSSS